MKGKRLYVEPHSSWLRRVLGRDRRNMLESILQSLCRNHWWETLGQMIKGVCLNPLVGPRSKSVKGPSQSQQYKTLFPFSLLNKCVDTLNVYISVCCRRSAVPPVFAETGLQESFQCPSNPIAREGGCRPP